MMKRCEKCPWLDMEMMRREHPKIVEAAEAGNNGWMCHVRLIPCPGLVRKEKP